jgi:thiamine monophosphate synthase
LDSFLGFEGYETILEQPIDVPIVAIGGITEADCLKLKEIGLNGIAVSSLLYNNGSQEMITRINKTFNL